MATRTNKLWLSECPRCGKNLRYILDEKGPLGELLFECPEGDRWGLSENGEVAPAKEAETGVVG